MVFHLAFSLSHTDTVHELCSHPSFTYYRHAWLLLLDRLAHLPFTVTSPLYVCLLRASSSLCARPYWRFTRRAWWNRSSPRCTNPTNAMPAFPKNYAEIHWQDLLHVMISQLHDRSTEKYLEPGTHDINKALLHFMLAKRLYAKL